MSRHFQVQKSDLKSAEMIESQSIALESGQARIQVQRFALTANNITYGVAGDMIGYWQFFPATDGWGRIPVWGIGEVVESTLKYVQPGTRYYGYFPMSNELVVSPVNTNARGFQDGASHRSELPAVYNQYTRVSESTGFAPDYENHAMLYRPLFTTSYVLDDYLADNDMFGASQVILSSASSKTAFGLAFMLKQRAGVRVTGLTSAANKDFVANMGLYDDVVTYDAVESLSGEPSVYVDMSGNREVLGRVHHHLVDDLKCSCGVGITHWESRDGQAPESLPGAKPTMFFAPSQIAKRHAELGAGVFQQQLQTTTDAFFQAVDAWVTIEEHDFDSLGENYQTMLTGPAPHRGFIILG